MVADHPEHARGRFGYLYDAEDNREAKAWLQREYIYASGRVSAPSVRSADIGSEQQRQLTNVYVGRQILATYDPARNIKKVPMAA